MYCYQLCYYAVCSTTHHQDHRASKTYSISVLYPSVVLTHYYDHHVIMTKFQMIQR